MNGNVDDLFPAVNYLSVIFFFVALNYFLSISGFFTMTMMCVLFNK